MILLLDSGSTSTQVALIDSDGNFKTYDCKGFNPYYYNPNEFYELLRNELYFKVKGQGIKQVFYYGSGCSSDANCDLVVSTLRRFFPSAEIQVEHDLFGAAIALYGHKRGIACILGTGSNSCLWDGERILENAPSLGYMLGDEGSGTYLGKIMLTEILSGEANPEIAKAFYREYKLSFSSILERIYREPYPNLFFSGISEFINRHIDHPWCQKLVKRNFTDFVDKQVSKYSTYQTSPVSFIGSVAYHFQELLEEVLDENNITFGKVMRSPMEGLIDYHINN
ncbi:MAG: ATPase [Bacteroidales bacterium]|jgi:N-acetylglucosamine kinase-like BadF-type ATPase|nr:ATPase [Bacteroidales bacterium]